MNRGAMVAACVFGVVVAWLMACKPAPAKSGKPAAPKPTDWTSAFIAANANEPNAQAARDYAEGLAAFDDNYFRDEAVFERFKEVFESGSTAGAAELKEAIGKRSVLLGRIQFAASKGPFRPVPVGEDGPQAFMADFVKVQSVARCLCFQAVECRSEGDWYGTASAAIGAMRVAEALQGKDCDLATWMSSVGIETMALRVVELLLASESLPPDVAVRLQSDLDGLHSRLGEAYDPYVADSKGMIAYTKRSIPATASGPIEQTINQCLADLAAFHSRPLSCRLGEAFEKTPSWIAAEQFYIPEYSVYEVKTETLRTRLALAVAVADARVKGSTKGGRDSFTDLPFAFKHGRFYAAGPDGIDGEGRLRYDPSNGIFSAGDITFAVTTKRIYEDPLPSPEKWTARFIEINATQPNAVAARKLAEALDTFDAGPFNEESARDRLNQALDSGVLDDVGDIRAAIAKQETVILSGIEAASEGPFLQPRLEHGADSPIPDGLQVLALARCCAYLSLERREKSDWNGAARAAIGGVRIGESIHGDNMVVLPWIAGVGGMNNGLDAIEFLLIEETLPAETGGWIADELQRIESRLGDSYNPVVNDLEATIRLVEDTGIWNLSVPDRPFHSKEELLKVLADLKAFHDRPLPSRLGEKLDMSEVSSPYQVALPNFMEVEARAEVLRARLRAAMALAAVRAGKAVDETKLIDPFSGKGLKRSGGAFYSIGPDGADQQGTVVYDPTNGSTSAGDIVLGIR